VPVIAWRLTRRPYQALDGEGARLYGGRWNSEGLPVVYASATLSLAALEYLVHVDPAEAPGDLVAMRLALPEDLQRERVDPSDLPPGWNGIAVHPECVRRGDAWAREGRTPLLLVPSAIVPEEENVLINPRHPAATRLAVIDTRPFAFDPRLLG
jgi:RES domain-containing protein